MSPFATEFGIMHRLQAFRTNHKDGFFLKKLCLYKITVVKTAFAEDVVEANE